MWKGIGNFQNVNVEQFFIIIKNGGKADFIKFDPNLHMKKAMLLKKW